jgi:Arc/MetJ-type ribon-helix-helix transcriptional regulator
MTYPKRPKPGVSRVREPVQVYLDPDDQQRLDRLTGRLSTSKSDVLRRGLEALERQLSDPSRHPALRIIGIAGGEASSACEVVAGADVGDVSREHDRSLSDAEEASWTGASSDDA